MKKAKKTVEKKSTTPRKKKMSDQKKYDTDDIANQIADDLSEFLTNYSEHINLSNPDVQLRIEDLAEAVAESMTDYEEEDEDAFLSYEGDMDQYGTGEDDDY